MKKASIMAVLMVGSSLALALSMSGTFDISINRFGMPSVPLRNGAPTEALS